MVTKFLIAFQKTVSGNLIIYLEGACLLKPCFSVTNINIFSEIFNLNFITVPSNSYFLQIDLFTFVNGRIHI